MSTFPHRDSTELIGKTSLVRLNSLSPCHARHHEKASSRRKTMELHAGIETENRT